MTEEQRRSSEEAFLESALEELTGGESPPDLRARILSAMQDESEREARRPSRWSLWTAALLLLGLGLVATIWALQQDQGSPAPVQQDPENGPRRPVEAEDLQHLRRLLSQVEGAELRQLGVDGHPAWVPGEPALDPLRVHSGPRLEGIVKSLAKLQPTVGTPFDWARDERLRLLLRGRRYLDVWVTEGVRQVKTPGSVRVAGIPRSFIAPQDLVGLVGPVFADFEKRYRLQHGIIGEYEALAERINPPARPEAEVFAAQWRLHGLEPEAFFALLRDRGWSRTEDIPGWRGPRRLDLRNSPRLRTAAVLEVVLGLPGLKTLILTPDWLYLPLPARARRTGLEQLILLAAGDCYWKLGAAAQWMPGDPAEQIRWDLAHKSLGKLTHLAVAAPDTDRLPPSFWAGLPRLARLQCLALHGQQTRPEAALPRAAELANLAEVYLLGVLPEFCHGLHPKAATGPAGVGLLSQVKRLNLSTPAPPPRHGGATRLGPVEMRPFEQQAVLAQLQHCSKLERLELNGWARSQAADAWWPELQQLRLRWLSLGDSPKLSAAQFLQLRNMPSLRTLILAGNGLGRAGEAEVCRQLLEAIEGLSIISN